ncbi:MAG: DUF4924 family protein [Muribaculaceae bacterium]|nr:DUF4924 family protein [Muribaculaceae bacterium]
MFIASARRKENIAEYLIYMWQIEDIIRANGLDIDRITTNVINRFTDLTDEQRRQLTEWYESLIDMMRRENVEKSGHLQLNKNVILQLADLHQALLNDSRFGQYSAEFYLTLPFIVELRAKSGDNVVGEIETCFNALYGMLMLKLAGKEVSSETDKAVKQITRFIAMLAMYFKKDSEEDLFKETE